MSLIQNRTGSLRGRQTPMNRSPEELLEATRRNERRNATKFFGYGNRRNIDLFFFLAICLCKPLVWGCGSAHAVRHPIWSRSLTQFIA
eukprot:4666599-Amphidinium_carterae.1